MYRNIENKRKRCLAIFATCLTIIPIAFIVLSIIFFAPLLITANLLDLPSESDAHWIAMVGWGILLLSSFVAYMECNE